MPLITLGAAIILLLILIVRLKLNAFLALLLTSFAVALANGLPAEAAFKSITRGIGDTMGSLVLILVFGAMLGKLIEESGAAHSISYRLTSLFGEKRIQLSVLLTGFIVGLPMIYNASFLVLIPLIYTLSVTTRLPLMYLGIPLSAALSVTHGYLPPHPAPASIAALYQADPNITLLYGLVIAIPATILAGPVLALFFRHLRNTPPPEIYKERHFAPEQLPGIGVSLFTALIPVLLMLAGAAVTMTIANGGALAQWTRFLSEPGIALLLAVLTGFYTLGLRQGRDMEAIMKSMGSAAAAVSMVILIIAAGGAFKQVLLDSGAGEAIKEIASGMRLSPLVLAWGAAALLRLALGSATVAAITAAGIVLPVIAGSGVRPELLVLATTAGSLMFSHFNDIGFWMFKEYYNVSIKQTFQVWTVMECIVAIVGLAGALLFHAILGPPPAAAAQHRVFYLNSYHAGYGSSDDVEAGIRATLAGQPVQLDVFYLDAKRAAPRVEEALAAIHAARPSLIIASDDDALRFVIEPHFAGGPIPVVFCGVNWTSSQYKLSREWVTGMHETVPNLEALKQAAPRARRLATVSEDSTSERSNTRILDPRYRAAGLEPSYYLVKDFAAWKSAFARANETADAVYIPTNGAIAGWNHEEAIEWARLHTRKPVVACDDFMAPYATFALVKVAREQGEWAAQTALDILLRGKRPSEIPLAENTQTRKLKP